MKLKNLSEKILRSVKIKGFKYIELPSVIETNHIVQRSGENFRKFIFSFTDQNGNELCLRPDLTIVSCLRYLENNFKGKEKIFYSGQAYRKSKNKKDSIIRNQIGFEIIGSKNEKIDDREIINTSLKSLKNLKYSSGKLTLGNVEIFNLLISKLDIPKRWKLRLYRHFWREDYFNDLLKRLETNSDVDPTIVEIDKKQIELIGVEAGGPKKSKLHAAPLSKNAKIGILHGAASYLCQNNDGQINETESISAGLDYPGVSPIHCFLKDTKRARYTYATDEAALNAYEMVTRFEKLNPSLEPSHAFAEAIKIAPKLSKDTVLIVNSCGDAKKDRDILKERLGKY